MKYLVITAFAVLTFLGVFCISSCNPDLMKKDNGRSGILEFQ